MTKFQELIQEAGIPEDVRPHMFLAANRYCNMVGGRMSDAVRSEISDYQRWGHDGYIKTVTAAGQARGGRGY
jgi:hypothetical protein